MGIKHRLALFGLLVIGSLSFAQPVLAADTITQESTSVLINKAGAASFSESIHYLFDGSHHGIYRDVPISTKLVTGMYLNYDFELGSALRDGQAEQRTVSVVGSYQRIKVGDPNTDLTGEHVYDMRYTLSPFVRHDAAGDYISVNVAGTRWEANQLKVDASITLPSTVTITSATCYTGAQGATDKNCTTEIHGNIVSAQATGALTSNQGMTVDIVTPENSFDTGAYNTPSKESIGEDSTNDTGISIIGLIVILIGLVVIGWTGFKLIRLGMKRKKYRSQQTIVAQYEAPDGLLPGEVGYLTDDTANATEITATLIHLATRGHLKIGYEEKKGIFGKKANYRLTKLGEPDKLTTYETILKNTVFADAGSVLLNELLPTKMAPAVDLIKADILSSLKKKGYYAEKQRLLSADNVTADGYKEWAKVEGLKLYLDVAEKDRINFHEAPERTPEHFSKLLPYAIALGVEAKWAQQFASIDVKPATTWYEGDMRQFNTVFFVSNLTSGFSSAVNSSFSPPSSSGGSGGGFSGGGGGGGGGGSW